MDENGASYRFIPLRNAGDPTPAPTLAAPRPVLYIPVPGNRMELDQLDCTLVMNPAVGVLPAEFVFTRKFGTTLRFEGGSATTTTLACQYEVSPAVASTTPPTPAKYVTQFFHRIKDVKDRFGNRLEYAYSVNDGKLIPATITAKVGGASTPPAKLTIISASGRIDSVTLQTEPGNGGTATDQQIKYHYSDLSQAVPGVNTWTLGYLDNVKRPGQTFGISYAMTSFIEKDTTPMVVNPSSPEPATWFVHANLSTIQSDGQVHEIAYASDFSRLHYKLFDNVPSGYYTPSGLPRIVSSVKLPGGHVALFGQDARDPIRLGKVFKELSSASVPVFEEKVLGRRWTMAVDINGQMRTWIFDRPQIVNADEIKDYLLPPHDTKSYSFDKLLLWTRMLVQHPAGLNESFEFDPSAGMALKRVKDCSGNVTDYLYEDKRDYSVQLPPSVLAQFGSMIGSGNSVKLKALLGGFYSDPTAQIRYSTRTAVPPLASADTVKLGVSGALITKYRYFGTPTDPAAFNANFYGANGYNAGMRVMSETTAPGGVRTKYEIDPQTGLRKVEKVYPPGGDTPISTTVIAYDTLFKSFITEEKGPDVTTTFTRDIYGRLAKTSKGNGPGEIVVSRTFYDGAGRLAASGSGEAGLLTQFAYDAGNRLIKTTYPNGDSESITYNEWGRKLSHLDGLGLATEWEYDKSNRKCLERRRMPGQPEIVVRWEYDSMGHIIKETAPNGGVTEFAYDWLGRLRQTKDAMGGVVRHFFEDWKSSNKFPPVGIGFLTSNIGSTAFSSQGWQPVLTMGPGREVTWTSLDAFYRPLMTARAVEGGYAVSSTTYHPVNGWVIAATDPAGKSTITQYDSIGRPVKVVGGVIGLNPSYAGSVLTSYFNGSLPWTEKNYSPGGLVLWEASHWRQGTETRNRYLHTEYNSAGNVRKQFQPGIANTPGGDYTEFTYDDRGNKTKEAVVSTSATPVTPILYVYDDLNRLKETTVAGDFYSEPALTGAATALPAPAPGPSKTSVINDSAGHPTEVTSPKGFITKTKYDAAGRVVEVRHPPVGVFVDRSNPTGVVTTSY
jgi:YD repeat-containing protein